MINFVDFASAIGFDLTPVQRAFARVAFDGSAISDLRGEDRELALELFGGAIDIPNRVRRSVLMLWGRGSGKSRLAQARLVHLALSVPIDLSPGEVAYAVTVGPDLRVAQDVGVFFTAAAEAMGLRFDQRDADRSTFVRDDGRKIINTALPATAGGKAIRGRPIVGCHFDEGAFFRDSRYRINFGDVFAAPFPRLLPGGQVITTSTPWAASGEFYSLFADNFGSARTALVSRAATDFVRPHERENCDLERTRDPVRAARELDCQFMSAESGFLFDPSDLDLAIACGREAPGPAGKVGVGCDFGFARDASAIVVVQRDSDCIRVAETLELQPTPGQPLKPSIVCRQFATVARRYGARSIRADRHHLESLREHFEPANLRIIPCLDTQEQKADAWLHARQLMREAKIAIPAREKKLLDQLRELMAEPLPGGVLRVSSPRGTRGGHGDLASAFVAAVLDVQKVRASDDPPPRALGHLEMSGPAPSYLDEVARRQGWRPIGGGDGGY